MSAQFYLRDLSSTAGGAGRLVLSQRTGRTNTTAVTTTVASGTNIPVTATAGGQALVWLTEPITEAITISGTITVNIRGLQNAANTNSGRGILIERTDNAGNVLSTILATTGVPSTITEFTTTDAANGAATFTPTSTAMAVGERIRVTLSIRAAGGTMGAGTATISYNASSSGTAGNTWVRFTESIRTDEILDAGAFEIRGTTGYYG